MNIPLACFADRALLLPRYDHMHGALVGCRTLTLAFCVCTFIHLRYPGLYKQEKYWTTPRSIQLNDSHTSVACTFGAGSRIRWWRHFLLRAKNCILCISHICTLELHSAFFGGNVGKWSYAYIFTYVRHSSSHVACLLLNLNLKCFTAAMECRSPGQGGLGRPRKRRNDK